MASDTADTAGIATATAIATARDDNSNDGNHDKLNNGFDTIPTTYTGTPEIKKDNDINNNNSNSITITSVNTTATGKHVPFAVPPIANPESKTADLTSIISTTPAPTECCACCHHPTVETSNFGFTRVLVITPTSSSSSSSDDADADADATHRLLSADPEKALTPTDDPLHARKLRKARFLSAAYAQHTEADRHFARTIAAIVVALALVVWGGGTAVILAVVYYSGEWPGGEWGEVGGGWAGEGVMRVDIALGY